MSTQTTLANNSDHKTGDDRFLCFSILAIMDARAINEKAKALVKATSTGESPSVIIAILNDLKNGVTPNEDILRSTRIGITVNKSKQHKNPDIARLAGEIVRKWRDEVQKGKPGTPNGRSKNGQSPGGTASPAPSQEKSKSSSAFSVPPDQRTWKKDKISVAHTGQSTRDNCIGLIYDGLVHMSEVAPNSVLASAVAVEAAAYHTFGPEDKEAYKSKMRSLYQNLKNKSNPGLRVRVLSGEIKADKFVVLSHEELKSDQRREEDEKIEKENMRAAQAPVAEKSVSTSLTCGKCGQKKVSYSQAQTRSADEPMTTFCECTVCGKRWKVSLVLDCRLRLPRLIASLVLLMALRTAGWERGLADDLYRMHQRFNSPVLHIIC